MSGGITATVDLLSAAGVGAMRRAAEARVASVKKLRERNLGQIGAERAAAGAATVAAAAGTSVIHHSYFTLKKNKKNRLYCVCFLLFFFYLKPPYK